MRRPSPISPEPRRSRITSSSPDERELASLAARLPDAAPDDVMVERIWRRLEDPEFGKRIEPWPLALWRGVALSTIALAVIASASVFWLRSKSPRAEVLLAQGGVFQSAKGADWVPARSGDPLSGGTSLRSDTSGQSVVRLPGVAALLLGTQADLTLEQLDGSTVLVLQRGDLTARVTRRPRDRAFSVRAGDFVVTVVGTLFSVTKADGIVSVTVTEGVVEVSGRGNRWWLEAGQRWSSDSPEARAAEALPPIQSALLLAALGTPPSPEVPELFRALVRSERATEESATPQPTIRAADSVPESSAHPPEIVTQAPRPQRERTANRGSRSPTSALRLARIDPAPQSVSVVPMVLAPGPPPAPSAASVPVRDDYAEALLLSRQGEHAKAAALLEKALATEGGPHDLELYHLALLRQRHLNDAQGALDALMGYRRQYPNGTLRQEVDLSIIEVDRTLGRTEAALSESARFLAAHPQSERADEMRVLRGDLLRQRGDCAGASVEYRSVTARTALDDALYYWAYCQRRLGDSASAAAALRDYLARFPAGHHTEAARSALGQ
jgi:ferric-dicitrate binding protein FerR (iron transport regulator)/tetratricopeptide (TPR) repeat protein